jgi:hypothetical protein
MRIRVPGLGRPRPLEAAASTTTVEAPEPEPRSVAGCEADTVALIYELLDAHQDTAELAERLWADPQWAAHLDYLCALQRTGRELLARMPAGEGNS